MRYSLMQNALLAIEKCIFQLIFLIRMFCSIIKLSFNFLRQFILKSVASGVANSNQIFILVFSVPCDCVYIPGHRRTDGLMNVQKDGEVVRAFYKSLH